MDIIQENEAMMTGKYRANVTIDNITIRLEGTFELPHVATGSALNLAVELAIRRSVEISIYKAEYDPQAS